MQIMLFEVTAAIDSTGTPQTFYFSTGKGYGGTGAPAYYEPRIEGDLPRFVSRLAGDLQTFGEAEISRGDVRIVNADGAYDSLLDYGYGFESRLLVGDDEGSHANFEEIAKGVVEEATAPNPQIIAFRFKDPSQELRQPIQPSKFLGTNSGATGIEGTADDIKGQVKPRFFGKCWNISPVMLNSSGLVFGFNFDSAGNTAPCLSITEVRDGGAVITPGTLYANRTLLEASSPGAGTFNYCTAESLIKLNTQPVYGITLDAYTARAKVGEIIEDILLDAGIPSSRIDAVSFAAFRVLADYTAGIYITNEREYFAVLSDLAGGAGGYLVPSQSGVYSMVKLQDPAALSPVLTLRRFSFGQYAEVADGDIVSFSRLASNDEGRGVPARRIVFNHSQNYTPQEASQLAGSVSAANKAKYAKQFSVEIAEDSAIVQQFPLAVQREFFSLISDSSHALTEATARFDLLGVKRAFYEVQVILTPEYAAQITLGSCVALAIPRFGLSAGKNFVVTQREVSAISNGRGGRVSSLKLVLWG
jgi:hypothetical protein